MDAEIVLFDGFDELDAVGPYEVLSNGRRAGADLTVRFGRFAERGVHERPLIAESVYPVCSPAFAATHGIEGQLDRDAIARLPLLHMDDRDPRWLDWPRWCQLAGLSAPPRSARFHYNNYPLLLNAAIEGNGLALGWHGLIGPLLEEGTLVALSPVVERTGQGYLLGSPHEDSAVIAPIVDWFVRECGGRA